MKKEYRWKPGAHSKVNAKVAADEIERIAHAYGGITPSRMVFEAKKKRNPLHNSFEWNDTIASKLYRESQARYILRSIEVVIGQDEDKPICIRAFHSVVEDDEKIYTTIDHAKENPELWEQVVEKAKAEIKSWRETYRNIQAFEAIFDAIDELV